jgi:complement component 1 Q subcomponent-binding protein
MSSAALRPLAARPSTLLKLSRGTFLRPTQASAFSTSVFRRAAAGETDEELSAKLESELQFEEEASQDEQLPASVKDFLDNSPFEIEDVPGREEVKLTRTFGDEK